MATMEQLEMLAGRAMLDQTFLHDLVTNPQYAANQVGISLTEDQVEKMKGFQEHEESLQETVKQLRGIRASVSPKPMETQMVQMVVW